MSEPFHSVVRWSAFLLLAVPAFAQSAHDRAGYGPASVCVGGYAVSVKPGEAVYVSGAHGGIMLRGEDFDLVQARAETGFKENRKLSVSTITLAGIGPVTKYHYPRQSVARSGIPGEIVFNDEASHNEYVLPATGGGDAVRVESDVFDGGQDRSVLARFSVRTGACDPLNDDAEGRLGMEVLRWSQVRVKGPAVVCEAALAIHIAEGEEAQRSWKVLASDFSWFDWRVFGPGWRADIGGARDFSWKLPTGRLDAIGYTIERHEGGATLVPPESLRKTMNDAGLVYLNTDGLDEQALKAFVHRLEYLPPTKRCRF